MSEEPEQQEPSVTDVPEPDQEPHEPAQPTPEEREEEEAHEAEEGEQAPPEPAEPGPDSEKEMRAVGKKLDAERDRHAKRLGDILGEAATETLPCPLCFEGLMGFVLPLDAGNVPEEQKAAALSFLGEAIPSALRPAEGVVMCDRCDGHGQLQYPTRNVHVQTQTCPKCSGNGYVPIPQAQTNVTQLPQQSNPPMPAAGGSAWQPTADQWGRPFGHQHYGVPPASVGG